MANQVKPTRAIETGVGEYGRPLSPQHQQQDRQLARWGAIAALAGVAAFVGTVVVVTALDLPDASDPETLTDFADIENGRIAEHFLYLAALALFACHTVVLRRRLTPAHPPAALFGSVLAGIGLVIMAASSMLHFSTAPLAELYSSPDTPPEDLPAIEYAWHGAQSLFDTMLGTGVLLVPIGIVLFGLAMRATREFGSGVAIATIVLGTLGAVGAAAEAIDTSSDYSAAGVLAIVVFFLLSGWQMLRIAANPDSATHQPAGDEVMTSGSTSA